MKTVCAFLTFALFCTVVDSRVRKCYVCFEVCNEPPDVQYCEEIFGPGQYLCSTERLEEKQMRSCVPDTRQEREDCAEDNSKTDSSCSLCDTDLCNSAERSSAGFLAVVVYVLFRFL